MSVYSVPYRIHGMVVKLNWIVYDISVLIFFPFITLNFFNNIYRIFMNVKLVSFYMIYPITNVFFSRFDVKSLPFNFLNAGWFRRIRINWITFFGKDVFYFPNKIGVSKVLFIKKFTYINFVII